MFFDWLGKFCAGAAFVAMLGGCAGPTLKQVAVDPVQAARQGDELRAIWLDAWLDDMSRLVAVGHRVAVAARGECGDRVKPWVGAFGANRSAFTQDYWRVAQARGIGAAFKIISVVPGSPADAAGLWPGDIILEVAGRRIAADGPALAQIVNLLKASGGQPGGTEFVVLRDGWELVKFVTPVRGCDFAVNRLEGQQVTASADADIISVHQSLLRYVRNEHELAMIMAHELSHNVLDHRGSKLQNAVVGTAVGFAFDVLFGMAGVDTEAEFSKAGMRAGATAYSQEFEAEADYMALYMLARAGYDVAAASNIFRRLASANPRNIDYAGGHPTTAYRVQALTQVGAEIEHKRRAGLPLYPDRAK